MTPCPDHEHPECEDCQRRTREDNAIALEVWQEKERARETVRRLNERATKAEGRAARAEAERLMLARAFYAATRDLDCGDNSCRFKAHGKGGMRTNGGCSCLGVRDGGGMRGIEVARTVEVARRIVAEADVAKVTKETT